MKSDKKLQKNHQRVEAKYFHVTLHKIENENQSYWLEKAKTFRSNVVAALVGVEANHEEEKGVHAHIVVQFTTKQRLSREQFVKHFGTNSVHISTPKNKDGLLNLLGYVSKTGNTEQYGVFTHRSIPLSANPEVYRFQAQVKTKLDAIAYFQKVIKENLHVDRNCIQKYAAREDAIGQYLVAHPSVTSSLIKLAHTWYLNYCNERKTGFKYQDFTEDPQALREAYKAYLKEFPTIFKKELPLESKLVLESDYDQHMDHDLEVVRKIIVVLKIAQKYGSKRPHKSLNLHLWSKSPSFGKSRLMKYLDAHMMAYRLPDDQYYVDYENNLYQILVSDEAANFIKTKTYSHLKLIFEGDAKVEFNRKGREKVMKEDNPLIVLADNEPFDRVMNRYFKGLYNKEVMETRVLDLQLKSRATLHFLLDRCLVPLGETK